MDTGLRCPTCGYNLTGLPENRCPECGEPFDPLPPPTTLPPEQFRKAARRIVSRFLLASASLGLVAVLIAAVGSPTSARVFWFGIPWLVAAVSTGVITAMRIERLTASSCGSLFGRIASGLALLLIVLAGEAGLICFSAIVSALMIAGLRQAI